MKVKIAIGLGALAFLGVASGFIWLRHSIRPVNGLLQTIPYATGYNHVAFANHGKAYAYAVNSSESFVVYNGTEGKHYVTTPSHQVKIDDDSVTFSPDGSRLAYLIERESG